MYNPNKQHRRSIRLQNWNYANTGAYFVTICSQNRECLFGEIADDKMILNEYGETAGNAWRELPSHHPYIELGEYIVMPNHIHGIITINATTINTIPVPVGARPALPSLQPLPSLPCPPSQQKPQPQQSPPPLSQIIMAKRGRHVAIQGKCVAEQRQHVAKTGQGRPCPYGPNDPYDHDHRQLARYQNPGKNTLSAIIGSYKSAVSKQIHRIGFVGDIWQRNYYEHIIRNETEYAKIAEYIRNNPILWKKDYLNEILDKQLTKGS
ncbi:MAG: hypothetical protein LBQ76_09330 [Candidatus Fibromonas sp.]|nr:hypothetical protein [Candidatus Fibromonas sp.]